MCLLSQNRQTNFTPNPFLLLYLNPHIPPDPSYKFIFCVKDGNSMSVKLDSRLVCFHEFDIRNGSQGVLSYL